MRGNRLAFYNLNNTIDTGYRKFLLDSTRPINFELLDRGSGTQSEVDP